MPFEGDGLGYGLDYGRVRGSEDFGIGVSAGAGADDEDARRGGRGHVGCVSKWTLGERERRLESGEGLSIHVCLETLLMIRLPAISIYNHVLMKQPVRGELIVSGAR